MYAISTSSVAHLIRSGIFEIWDRGFDPLLAATFFYFLVCNCLWVIFLCTGNNNESFKFSQGLSFFQLFMRVPCTTFAFIVNK